MDHLTPDVLAAWMDGTLSASERSAAEAHAADCAHCQAMLAAMARTAPVAQRRAWWSAPAVRWLVPVAAAGVVVAVWLGIEREQDRAVQESGRTVSAVIKSAGRVPPAEPARPEPQSSAANAAPAREARPESAKMRTRTSEDAARGERAQAFGGVADQNRVDSLAPNAAPVQAPQPVLGVAQSALPPSTAAPAAAPAPAPAAPTPAPTSLLPIQETVTVTGESPMVKSSARAATAAARVPTVDVISPEPAYRWRTAPGSVLHSVDGGVSWSPSSTGTSVVFHAGSAPSRSVCWLVGQAGTVLLTTDGQTWQLRPFPERVNLTEVRAADARNATVTTADRRRFATTDGGATWSPLQEN